MAATQAVVLVTGAAGGIGQEIVRALGRASWHCVATDLDGDAVEVLADEVEGSGFALDIADRAMVDDLVEMIETDVGPITGLVNCAGILTTGSALTLESDQWRRAFSVNCDGVMHCLTAVGARMAERGSGSIVTVASNAAHLPRTGMAAYGASKAAAAYLTRVLGLELAGRGVRCNIVSPGSTNTAMLRGMWADGAGLEATLRGTPNAFKGGIPLARIAEPADVAEAVSFLLSERARHITLHDLTVDGGADLGA